MRVRYALPSGSRSLLPSLIFLMSFLVCGGAFCAEEARVVLIVIPTEEPAPDRVQEILQEHLGDVQVRVDVTEREALPDTPGHWIEIGANQAAKEPGTLAIFGWRCEEKTDCTLYMVDTGSGSFAAIPVRPDDMEDHDSERIAFALAATARESIWGAMFPVMRRLIDEGKNPKAPALRWQREPGPYIGDGDSAGQVKDKRPWMWLEWGYHGEYPHPTGQSLHGPWVGAALSPGKNLVPFLQIGWLGLQSGQNEQGVVKTHRFPISLALRIYVPIGPAMFSVAPVGRVDFVIAKSDPIGPRGESTGMKIEVHAGAATTWHLPLPSGKVEAVIGMGALATILGHDYKVDGQSAVAASGVRFIWMVGMAWSPL